MNLRALDTVEDDLVSAARRIEKGRAGYGLRVFTEYRAVLDNIAQNPQMYPPVEDALSGREFRNALLGRLGYRVVYEVRKSELLIVAVLYTGRQPELWHPRVPEE